MSNSTDQPAPKQSTRTVIVVLLSVFGLMVFSCCFCGPILSLFVTTDMDRANKLWDGGQKAEAVEIYTAIIDDDTGRPNAVALQRPIEYHHEAGDLEQAKRFCRVAAVGGIELTLDTEPAQKFYEKERATYDRNQRVLAATEKEKEERRIAESQERSQAELEEKRKAFQAVLANADIRLVERIHVRKIPDDLWEATLTVNNTWHVRAYQIRLQDAQVLWEAWVAIASPQARDSARIKIVDLNGNEVGGSRLFAGSLIWVQDQ